MATRMNVLNELKHRFQVALSSLVSEPQDVRKLLEMIRESQNPQFGDYQANCAMPLGKTLKKPPREVAQEILSHLDVSDLCDLPEIAGPGFINLRLRDDWLVKQLQFAVKDQRLGVPQVQSPRTYVVDYSSPNVAKPMHVGHIRSTVIGDALCQILRFLGHEVISDNHLGDWGTQFGMIIYGYKHFVDQEAFENEPVQELGRLYRQIRRIMDLQEIRQKVPKLQQLTQQLTGQLENQQSEKTTGNKETDKKAAKSLRRLESQLKLSQEEQQLSETTLADMEADEQLVSRASEHPNLGHAVLGETAKLHAGDEENIALWKLFLPMCREEMQTIYKRLGIQFDFEYGESFYHDRLADVVQRCEQAGIARVSEGAMCVFLDGFDTPMIIRKQDGAYLYATTDLATVDFRRETWQPDVILYVVDFRQGEHFEKLFTTVDALSEQSMALVHVSFGTVLGEDGRPFRTRAGDTVGLESLLDEAVERAHRIVCELDENKPAGSDLTDTDRQHIARVVGHAAIKYADLSQNRTSDYKFSYDKMVSMQGNTSTYLQYSYARVQGIFRKGGIDIETFRGLETEIILGTSAERDLALQILRFSEVLESAVTDYYPSVLTGYLFERLSKSFSTFFEQHPVLKAETSQLRDSRLLLCDLTGRTIRQGLELLGIEVLDRM